LSSVVGFSYFVCIKDCRIVQLYALETTVSIRNKYIQNDRAFLIRIIFLSPLNSRNDYKRNPVKAQIRLRKNGPVTLGHILACIFFAFSVEHKQPKHNKAY